MSLFSNLSGVYAASITPLTADFRPDLEALPLYLDFLARRGCHGALLLGTTGEGPSFSTDERQEIFKAAETIRQVHPKFRLLAGTGTPSLEETKKITRSAFNLGFDGAVILPPYYYRTAKEDGLYAWFNEVIETSVPNGGAVFGYHIPSVSGVPLSIELLARLKDAFPNRFAGVKDSSGDANHAAHLGDRFGNDLVVLTGNDRLLTTALKSHASGCITAMTNLFSPFARQVWDSHIAGDVNPSAQENLNTYRVVMEKYPPAPPLLKGLLPHLHDFPTWFVRPPLMPFTEDQINQALADLQSI